jgi:O-antigen/teichoic acid export membrane protein
MAPVSVYKRAAVKGFGWQTAGLFGQNAVQFVFALVFARLLLREEYGVAMVALTVAEFATLLRVAGLAQAFIASPREEEEIRDTVFWLSASSGAFFTAALFFGAPLFGRILGDDALTPLLRALAAVQALDLFRVVPFGCLMRRLQFREKAISEAMPGILAVCVAVGAAFVLPAERRIWALIGMPVLRAFLQVVFFLWYAPYVPRARFDRAIAKELLKSSYAILGSNLPSSLLELIPTLAVQQRAGAIAAGGFRIANNLTVVPSRLGHTANYTLFPILAKLRSEPDRLRNSLVRAMKTVGTLSTGMLGAVWVTAPALVPLLFGQKWSNAVAATQWLAVAAALRLYTYVITNALLATGREMPSVWIWGSSLLVGLVALYGLPMQQADPTTGAIALAISVAVGFAGSLWAFYRQFGASFADVLASLLPSTLAVGVGGALGYGALLLFSQTPLLAAFASGTVYTVAFLAIAGILLGAGPLSLFTIRGIKEVIRTT